MDCCAVRESWASWIFIMVLSPLAVKTSFVTATSLGTAMEPFTFVGLKERLPFCPFDQTGAPS